MQESLQEHVDLERVEALPFIWRERERKAEEVKDSVGEKQH